MISLREGWAEAGVPREARRPTSAAKLALAIFLFRFIELGFKERG
jgi:hypothetical protein